MDTISGINSSTALANLIAANVTDALFTPNTSVLTNGLFETASTIVDLSVQGPLLSVAETFQNRLQTLHYDLRSAGQSFGTDFAKFAAKVQSFADAFNGLQSSIANINSNSLLPGVCLTGAAALFSRSTQKLRPILPTTIQH